MDIIQAINHEDLFLPFLGDSESWDGWKVLLRGLYMPRTIKSKKSIAFFKEATGRDPSLLPDDGFDQFLALTGRRSGKSRITSIVAAFESAVGRRWERCDPGESPHVVIISPRKAQSQIIKRYVREIFEAPLLKQMIVAEQADGFELENGVHIRIFAGDGGIAVRGTTAICICLDEVCFHGVDVEAKIKNDAELVRACLPSLATTGGKLIAISSPYARKGWAFDEHHRAFANDDADDILVVNGPSRLFNPTLPQKVVDRATKRDRQAAKSEYLGEFRDACTAFLELDMIMACVVEGRDSLMPEPDQKYFAAVDISGGRHDASACAIGHKSGSTIVVDKLAHYPAPHEPQTVVRTIARLLETFGCHKIVGDRYAGSWVSDAFARLGIAYTSCVVHENGGERVLTASDAYLEMLPVICTPDALELPDSQVLIKELSNLERRARQNGKDQISHPIGKYHDDAANALALLVVELSKKRVLVGAY
jgi:hypothetical protein